MTAVVSPPKSVRLQFLSWDDAVASQDDLKLAENLDAQNGCDSSTGRAEEVQLWKRLGVILLVAIIPLIVAWALRPYDRIMGIVFPPLVENPGHKSSRWTNYVLPMPPQKSQFSFRQCHPNATLCCNGLENACNLRINEAMFATVHNAMATREDGYLLHPNHYFSLERALNAGYRGLHLEVCKCNGIYELCHGICTLGARDPVEVFLDIDRFLEDNSEEALLLNLQFNNDAHQEVDIAEFYQVMGNITHFPRRLYVHENAGDDWPTLGEMIRNDKRVLLFHSHGPTCETNSSCPPGMHYWPHYARESKVMNVANLSQIDQMADACQMIGIDMQVHDSKQFYAINHFAPMPDFHFSERLNDFGFLSKRVESCAKKHPNIQFNLLAVDFWSVGTVVEFVQRQNMARSAMR